MWYGKVAKGWWLNEDKPVAVLMERMAAAGGCLRHGISHCDDNLPHTQATSLPSAFNIGEISSRICFLQGKNAHGFQGRMNCSLFPFWVNKLMWNSHISVIWEFPSPYREFPSLALTRGREIDPNTWAYLVLSFLRTFFLFKHGTWNHTSQLL